MSGDFKFGLSPQTLASLKAIFSRYSEIEKVVLYGSRAKGNFKVGSDIDLTLMAPGLDLTGLLKIEDDIEELMLPYKVDLSLFHQIENPDLREHIKRVGITL
jgi:predicted nucleotidyltransferase